MSRRHWVRERLARGGLVFTISLICVGSVNATRPILPPAPEPTAAPESTAEPAPEPPDAADGDVEIALVEVAGQTVAEVDIPAGDAALSDDEAAALLLDVSPDGTTAVVVAVPAPGGAPLVMTAADGSARTVPMPGVLDASFSPDGSWIAAIDAAGALWKVDLAVGTATALSPGPFTAPIGGVTDERILLQAVSSVEAPYDARAVSYDLATGASIELSAEGELVYAARELPDGSVTYVAHLRTGGTAVVEVAADGAARRQIMLLGDEVANPAIAPDGRAVAYEVVGDGIYLASLGGLPRRLAAGEAPAFSPDGSSLLVRNDGRSMVIDRAGLVLAALDESTAAWVRCGGCRP